MRLFLRHPEHSQLLLENSTHANETAILSVSNMHMFFLEHSLHKHVYVLLGTLSPCKCVLMEKVHLTHLLVGILLMCFHELENSGRWHFRVMCMHVSFFAML